MVVGSTHVVYDEVRRIDLRLLPRLRAMRRERIQQRHLQKENAMIISFLNLSYVCPEPVLVK